MQARFIVSIADRFTQLQDDSSLSLINHKNTLQQNENSYAYSGYCKLN
ncbi:hypothetical protein SAMN05421830_1175 [Desulfomicrobium norvegicum]|uniref:Uncharacterized protein n=1 Tax=Desulfomicrobium norvegicum (strain DSM 1741 / NCIMB 8310) TaxID=52561 RepID=A0A8G2F5Y9_DESNO|nr:hypothetical protein SAMN05421830_1175 [Desulfomicrobium norvegicum]